MSGYRNPVLDAMPPYVAGKPASEVAREHGVARVVKLASNENALGPSPKAVDALRRRASEAHIYPDDHCRELAGKVAAKLGVGADQLLFGTGSDDAMHLAVWAFGRSGSAALCPQPGFLGYPIFAQSFGLRPVPVPLPGYEWDLGRMAEVCRSEKAGFVFLACANSPTGTGFSHADAVAFLESIDPATPVILDLAYQEFDPEPDRPDGPALVRRFENAIVCGTFSKAYGLAGLRLGYAAASPERIQDMKRLRTPFAANGAALEAALAALDDPDHLRRSVELAQQGVAWWTKKLTERGLRVVPSRANFVMTTLDRDAGPVYAKMLTRGVIVRHLGAFGEPNALRITCGTPEENAFALAALDEALGR